MWNPLQIWWFTIMLKITDVMLNNVTGWLSLTESTSLFFISFSLCQADNTNSYNTEQLNRWIVNRLSILATGIQDVHGTGPIGHIRPLTLERSPAVVIFYLKLLSIKPATGKSCSYLTVAQLVCICGERNTCDLDVCFNLAGTRLFYNH